MRVVEQSRLRKCAEFSFVVLNAGTIPQWQSANLQETEKEELQAPQRSQTGKALCLVVS